LPAKAEKIVRPVVWELSRQTAGLYIGFCTDSTNISARWTLLNERLDGYVMPAVCKSSRHDVQNAPSLI